MKKKSSHRTNSRPTLVRSHVFTVAWVYESQYRGLLWMSHWLALSRFPCS